MALGVMSKTNALGPVSISWNPSIAQSVPSNRGRIFTVVKGLVKGHIREGERGRLPRSNGQRGKSIRSWGKHPVILQSEATFETIDTAFAAFFTDETAAKSRQTGHQAASVLFLMNHDSLWGWLLILHGRRATVRRIPSLGIAWVAV